MCCWHRAHHQITRPRPAHSDHKNLYWSGHATPRAIVHLHHQGRDGSCKYSSSVQLPAADCCTLSTHTASITQQIARPRNVHRAKLFFLLIFFSIRGCFSLVASAPYTIAHLCFAPCSNLRFNKQTHYRRSSSTRLQSARAGMCVVIAVCIFGCKSPSSPYLCCHTGGGSARSRTPERRLHGHRRGALRFHLRRAVLLQPGLYAKGIGGKRGG